MAFDDYAGYPASLQRAVVLEKREEDLTKLIASADAVVDRIAHLGVVIGSCGESAKRTASQIDLAHALLQADLARYIDRWLR